MENFKFLKTACLVVFMLALFTNCSSSEESDSDNTDISSAEWTNVPFSEDNGYGIYSSCTNGKDLFIGTAADGIYKSVDGGKNWIAINNGLIDKRVCKVYYLNNTLYATTSFISPGSSTKTQIYKSIDNGNTWISVWNTLYDYKTIEGSYYSPTLVSQAAASYITGSVGTIAIIDSNIFVTIGSYVFKSSNNGIDWKFIKAFDTKNQYNGKQFLKVNSNIFLLSSYLGFNVTGQIYKSLDGGNNFSLMNNELNDERSITSMAFLNNTFFIATGSGSTPGNIYRTDENISNLTLSMKNNLSPTSVFCFYSIDNNLFAGRNNEVFISKDKGNSWENYGEKLEGACLDFYKIGNFIYLVTNTKIYKTNY
ncbi:beta propeller repeat protein [Flavobacterium bizetiae]|uniref:hypothetical protein n=1 Tax=Flavobacterium bizetiae TaxID=2704140 RepID=UPI003756C0F8